MGLAADQASARSEKCVPRPKTCPARRTVTTPKLNPMATPRTPRTCTRPTVRRTPLPNTVDHITKEVKYGDPHHRDCERRPASAYLPREKHAKYSDKTHTSVGTIRLGSGAIWAIPHYVKPTGYKHPRAWPKFDDLTSKCYFEKKTRKAGEEIDSLTKKLCPYDPNANRNLPKEVHHSNVGLHSLDCRNASYHSFTSGKEFYFKTPKTTNQSYFKFLKQPTGFNNPIIFAVARVL